MSSDRHKVCPTCGTANSEDSWFCKECSTSLAHVRTTTLIPDDTPNAPTPEHHSETNTPPNTPCHACQQPLPPNASECIYCHTPTPDTPNTATRATPRIILRLPWGTETLDATLRIGRDAAFHNLSQSIPHQHDNVSRRHAQLDLNHHNITITDLGSSNGTFVNNHRIPPHQPTPITPPVTLRFGADVQAELTSNDEP